MPCALHRGSDQSAVSIHADHEKDEFSNLAVWCALLPPSSLEGGGTGLKTSLEAAIQCQGCALLLGCPSAASVSKGPASPRSLC